MAKSDKKKGHRKKKKPDETWFPGDFVPTEPRPLANPLQLEALNELSLMTYAIDFGHGQVFSDDAYFVLSTFLSEAAFDAS